MLKKITKCNSLTNEEDLILKKGTICGISIKPIKVSEKKIKNIFNASKTVTRWGFYLYIRMDEGYEYEAAWKMQKTYSINDFRSTPRLDMNNKKQRIEPSLVIPLILSICGVNDSCALIGKEIDVLESKVYDNRELNEDGFAISSTKVIDYLYPDYFSIRKI